MGFRRFFWKILNYKKDEFRTFKGKLQIIIWLNSCISPRSVEKTTKFTFRMFLKIHEIQPIYKNLRFFSPNCMLLLRLSKIWSLENRVQVFQMFVEWNRLCWDKASISFWWFGWFWIETRKTINLDTMGKARTNLSFGLYLWSRCLLKYWSSISD